MSTSPLRTLRATAVSFACLTAAFGGAQAQVAPSIDGVARQLASNAQDLREMSRIVRMANVGGLSETQVAEAMCRARGTSASNAAIGVAFKRFAARAMTDLAVLESAYRDCSDGETATASIGASEARGLDGWRRNSAVDRADVAASRGLGAPAASAPVVVRAPMDISTAAVQIASNARNPGQVSRVVDRAVEGGLSRRDVAEAFCMAGDIAEDPAAVETAYDAFAAAAGGDRKALDRAFTGCEGFATAAIPARPAARPRIASAAAPEVQAAALQLAEAAPDQRRLDEAINLGQVSGLNEMQLAQSLCLAGKLADGDAVRLAYDRFAARATTDPMLLNEAFGVCPGDVTAATAVAAGGLGPNLFEDGGVVAGGGVEPALAEGGLVGGPLAPPAAATIAPFASGPVAAAGPAGAIATGAQTSAALTGGLTPSVQSIALQLSDNSTDTRAISKILSQAGVSGLSEMQIAQSLCFATSIAPTDAELTMAFVNFAKEAESDLSLLQQAFTSCTDQPTAATGLRATSNLIQEGNPQSGGGVPASPN